MLNFLNPQKWIGQIVVILGFLSIGMTGGYILKEKINPCPPSTQINYDQKIKAKKNSDVITSTNCEDWLKSLSNKDIRNIKKGH